MRFRAGTALCLILFSPVALAHGGLDIGGFYQGILATVLHWELLLLLVAGGLWCAQQQTPDQPWLGAALTLGIVAGFAIASTQFLHALSSVPAGVAYTLAGGCVAMRLDWHKAFTLPLGLLSGLIAGLALGAGEIETLEQPLFFTAGLALGVTLALFYSGAAALRLPAGWPWIGVRILGSWIAAVGLITTAYALKAPL